MADIVVRNGKLVTPEGVFEGGLSIEGEKIKKVAKDMNLPKEGKTIDAKGNYILPGAIDVHCHIGWPDWPLEQGCKTDTAAAAFGGVTTVINFIIEPGSLVEAVERQKKIFEANSQVDFLFYAGIFDENHIEEIPTIFKAGVPGFKFFLPYRGSEATGGMTGIDDGILYLGFKKIATLPFPARALVHPENVEPFWKLKSVLMKQGRGDLAAWAEARPNFLEEEAYVRSLYFSKRLGCPLHTVHISAAGSVDIAHRAKAEGSDFVACIQPQYFTLDDKGPYGILGKVNPPIRSAENSERLWWGLREGVIDMVGSDHAPVPRKYKQNLWEAVVGIPNVETYFQAMVSEGVSKGRIDLERLVQVCSYNPARIHGLYPRKGALIEGADADIVIVDMHKEKKITTESLHQVTDYSPYEGWTFKGQPVLTMVRGQVAMENDSIQGKQGWGEYLDFKTTPS
ncbi:MAG: dihydroorotase family protein [Candidatus Bathyarchaeia archaeon]